MKLFLLFVLISVAYSDIASPLKMWGNHPLIAQIIPFAGPMDPDNFYAKFTQQFLENKVEVFVALEKALEIQDLLPVKNEPDPFFNVNNMAKKSKYNKLFFQLNRPLQAFINNTSITETISTQTFENLSETIDFGGVHIMKMGYNPYDRINSLKVHDRIIYKACHDFAEKYPSYVCILTGLSGVAALEEAHIRIPRSAEAEKVVSERPSLNLYYSKDVGMVYTKSPPKLTILQSNTTYNLNTLLSSTTQGKSLIIQLKDSSDSESSEPSRFRLQFNFASKEEMQTWSLDGIEITKIKSGNKEILTPNKTISTSLGYSFHTPSLVFFKSNGYILIFNSTQVELWSYGNHSMRFDVADDTVYFFTIPILSGLFVCTLLVTIVLLGLSMIFDIKTMDLFDDPKGKTVTINAAE